MENNEAAFCLKDVLFGYDKAEPVLRGIDLTIPKGEITAVLGPNGCGKSTLFHLICGTLKADGGSILLGNRKIEDIPRKEFAREVSIVHQYNVAPDDITVRKLVSMGRTPYHGMLSNRFNDEDIRAVNRALEITDTEKFADKYVSNLSGGQRQRVWLAMALAQNTKILLLDEITTYLDIYYQLQLLRMIADLRKDYGITVMMVLHDINQAMEFCSKAVLMDKGNILAAGDCEKIINEENLLKAFHVRSELHNLEGRQYCIFK